MQAALTPDGTRAYKVNGRWAGTAPVMRNVLANQACKIAPCCFCILRTPALNSHACIAASTRRQRSGKEVREFLLGLGVCLDSAAAVIKQARVTSLADSASPADLAAVVAEASGLGEPCCLA